MTPTELLQHTRSLLQKQIEAIDLMIICNEDAEQAISTLPNHRLIGDEVGHSKHVHIKADMAYNLARTAANKTMLRYYDTKRPGYVYNETNTAALPGEIDRRMSGLENISN